ncbi:MAG: hypothetical protein IJZ53_04505 [Tyzzerella sp.]|nr:hypothetical protein [Tyzzerella sp.]
MTIFEKSTNNLMNTLKQTSPSELKGYLQENFSEGTPSFSNYLDILFVQKNLKRQDVLIRANLPQKYGYKLLTGEVHTTNRDKILCICFAMEMSLKQTQRALKLYGMNELYTKIKRDVLLIVALGQKIYDIDKVNEMLINEDEQPLYDIEAVE